MKLSMKSGKRVYSLGGLLIPFHRTKLNIFPMCRSARKTRHDLLNAPDARVKHERFACFCVLSQWPRNKKSGKSSGGLHAAAN